MCTYKRERSQFYLRIFENPDCISISVNEMVLNLLNILMPELSETSPKGWKQSSKYENLFNLWIPENRIDTKMIDYLNEWAEKANSHIWLNVNKNTNKFFRGDEIDYCLASDWNFDFTNRIRTTCGEAEYQLKYQLPKRLVDDKSKRKYVSILKEAISDSIECLPFDISSFFVTTIPAIKENQSKLSWKLANYVADRYDSKFIKSTLLLEKPQMKEQKIEDKFKIWTNIYSDLSNLEFSHKVKGKNILIIDDLYQSGVSIWCYATILKKLGAKTVIAITAVKSLKDGDNT